MYSMYFPKYLNTTKGLSMSQKISSWLHATEAWVKS